ncbi:hypothetical protein [Kitasatospora sp. CB02891]|uniref:hypothetical protein n=1 Tax=Kitasatospora sp. CB02891 TaxID=2020329 RepID=UPI000C2710E4|nr:hypothetical protein [Kitasatospora sp. CB02891]PJN24059.1 hypothetical protein CG736_19375 [Kitasatospora sp. CB02891]
MSLPPLATQADATAYGYTLPPTTADGLLNRASARIRRAAGQPITSSTSTVRLEVTDGTVTLPGPPVTAVSSVLGVACDGTTTALEWWCWDGSTLTVPYGTAQVDVVFTRGYPVVPDGIVELTCAVAARLAATPAGAEGLLRSRQIDDYSETYATEAIAAAGDLLPGERDALEDALGTPEAWMTRSQ